MVKRRAAIVLFAILLTAVCRTADTDVRDKTYFVQNVIDGDTIELEGGGKVRYIGVDTPETMKRKGTEWVLDPEAFGVEAKDYNKRMVFHKNVKLEFDITKKDKFNRSLAYVYNENGVMVNEELLKEGLAVIYTFPPNVKYVERLLAAQNSAKSQKKGLWGAIEIITPDQAGNFIGRWAAVRGEIVDIFISPYTISLSFGRDPNRALTAVIFTKNLILFTKMGIDPVRDYKGKTVELVGKVEYRNGPQILIDNPSQIKILE